MTVSPVSCNETVSVPPHYFSTHLAPHNLPHHKHHIARRIDLKIKSQPFSYTVGVVKIMDAENVASLSAEIDDGNFCGEQLIDLSTEAIAEDAELLENIAYDTTIKSDHSRKWRRRQQPSCAQKEEDK